MRLLKKKKKERKKYLMSSNSDIVLEVAERCEALNADL